MTNLAPTDWKSTVSQAVQGNHMVQVYSDPSFLYQSVGLYVDRALKAGRAAILITRTAHWESIGRNLRERGWDLERLQAAKQLTRLSAQETLDRYMVNGRPNGRAFREIMGGLI